MENDRLTESAREQLDRVLSFFPRVDALSSVVLGVDVGMLALLANSILPPKTFDWRIVFAAAAIVLIGLSLIHLYKGSFPRLDGGWHSLIYFREIAQRNEADFIKEFSAQRDEDYTNDLLSQVWRNSEILTQKFDHLKRAFYFLAWAVIPWAVALAVFSSQSADTAAKVAK